MENKRYPSDLTDDEWDYIRDMIPEAKPGGRPRKLNMREVVNGLFYLVKGGIQWRMLPKDFPNWKSIYNYFREWKRNGFWQQIHDKMRAEVRKEAGRNESPSAAILDSQSVKTTEQGGPQRGYDAGKKVNGRKRHLLVDTMGLILIAVVHAACIQDRDGAKLVLEQLKDTFKRLRKIWADAGYAGMLIDWVRALRKWGKIDLEIVKRNDDQVGFAVQPHRWIVERTLAWLGRYRRLSKDYETLPSSSETMIYLAMIRLMLRRLCPS
ncbi:MAG: IS5 family transposase [Nitrososphaera sp.]